MALGRYILSSVVDYLHIVQYPPCSYLLLAFTLEESLTGVDKIKMQLEQ